MVTALFLAIFLVLTFVFYVVGGFEKVAKSVDADIDIYRNFTPFGATPVQNLILRLSGPRRDLDPSSKHDQAEARKRRLQTLIVIYTYTLFAIGGVALLLVIPAVLVLHMLNLF